MTLSLFVTLLTVFSAMTAIVTEGIKKLLDSEQVGYSANILAFLIACVVGIGGTAIYYALNSIPFVSTNILCMVLMGIATSIGAMVGYDKVIQTIQQIKSE